MSNLIGQSLGRYHILEQLGEGGMAIVYKAYDTRLETEVAVKVIRTDKFTPEALARTLKRFESEAKDMARLTHPNIVKVTDYGEFEGQPYLVMPYLPGGNLKQYLRDHGRLSWHEAVRILIPIAQALGFAHRYGVIHRDIKPANILLTQDGQPMLTDFGVAKVVEEEATHDLTGSGVGVGTPEYMAPEQTGRNFDQRVDIYALGIVFYELVTGRRPYEGDTPLAVLLKQVNEPLPRPRQFVLDLPVAVEKVIIKALAKKPEDRYRNMDEFATAMERLSSVSSGATVKRWLAWGIGGAALLLVVAVVWGISSFGKIPAPAFTETPSAVASPVLIVTQQPTNTSQVTKTSQPTETATATSLPTSTLGIGSTWTRPADGMVMVYVLAGKFLMGSADSDPMAQSNEKPQQSVYLDAYWIDKTDVTNAMYAICVNAGGCYLPSGSNSSTRPSYYSNSQYADYPVIYVSWASANSYCSWGGARLPTEAEWEKAARGTDGRIYPWANPGINCSLANLYPYGSSDCVGDTSEVGMYPSGASSYGALDMAGNVRQWVNDWYDAAYYASSPSSNPQGPSGGTNRVVRGGSWNGNDFSLRSALRNRYNSTIAGDYIGFRCARSSP